MSEPLSDPQRPRRALTFEKIMEIRRMRRGNPYWNRFKSFFLVLGLLLFILSLIYGFADRIGDIY